MARLHEQVANMNRDAAETAAKIQNVSDRIKEFQGYLISSKFHEDTTIQAREVYDFLRELNSLLP